MKTTADYAYEIEEILAEAIRRVPEAERKDFLFHIKTLVSWDVAQLKSYLGGDKIVERKAGGKVKEIQRELRKQEPTVEPARATEARKG